MGTGSFLGVQAAGA